MKKIAILAAALLFSAEAGAKSLNNTSGLAPATDSVYSAVVKVNTELDVMYTYINTLFKLQAASAAPTGNATYDVWEDTSTTPPTVKYYDGDSWEALISTAFTSSLTLEASVVGMKENCTLERETATSTKVMINATAYLPATIEVAGKLLQVAAKITLNFNSVAAGTYYVHATRAGATSAFTLDYDASRSATVHYLGEVTLSATSTISRVVSYEGYEAHRTNPALGMFQVHSNAAQAQVAAYNKLTYNVAPHNAEGLVADSRFTPNRRGVYELNATQTNASAVAACVQIQMNAGAVATNCGTGTHNRVSCYAYMDGVDDYAEVWSIATGGNISTAVSDAHAVAFWGRWIGASY